MILISNEKNTFIVGVYALTLTSLVYVRQLSRPIDTLVNINDDFITQHNHKLYVEIISAARCLIANVQISNECSTE